MKKVFLGVGHGGSDPGAVYGGILEKNLNLPIALSCRDLLVSSGVTVLLSRSADENDPLTDVIRECNAFQPDLAVDIHNNAGGGDGAEAFHHYKGGIGKTLAENILSEIVAIGQNSRGAKIKKNGEGKDYFGFIRQTVAPAVIVECAFLDSVEDVKNVNTPEKQKLMGEAIARGILATLGITPAQIAPPSEEAIPDSGKSEEEGENLAENKAFFAKNREILKEAVNRFFRWLDT